MAGTHLDSVLQDLNYAQRTMLKSPLFTAIAVLTLSLGIGANTASFSVIQAVLLKPLEYRNADRLVEISGGATPVRFAEMQASAQSFTSTGAFTSQEDLTLTGGAEPEVIEGARVSDTFLNILGINPVLGRGFLPAEDLPAGDPVALISAELWQRRFNGSPHIVGRAIDLSGTSYNVVGVLPSNFKFPIPNLDVWLAKPTEWPGMSAQSRRLSPFLTLFGRLKPGVTIAQASAEAVLIHHRYAASHPAMLDAKPKSPVRVTPFKETLVGAMRSQLWLMFGAVGCVLLIACANLASLLLARAATRSREFAVRSALGATRPRLFRQVLVESVLLSSAGGLLGILCAALSLSAIRHFAASILPRADEIHMDATVLSFAVILSCATGVLFGLIPALSASRPDFTSMLRARTQSSSSSSPARFHLGLSMRGLLVIAQIALSIVLLIGAALLIQSVLNLRANNPGFDPNHLLTLRISLPPHQYATDSQRSLFFEQLLQRLRTNPAVQDAAAAMTLPMTGFAGTPVQDANQPLARLNQRPIATILIITPQYFDTLKIPRKRGRTFTDHDRQNTTRVAIIDEGLATRFWPSYPRGRSPIGQHLMIGGINLQPAEIIGIVANVHQTADNSGWPISVYQPFLQNPLPSAMLAIRSAGDPLALTASIRHAVQSMDRNQPLADVESMHHLVDAQLGDRRLLAILLGAFSCTALLLSIIGVYGVIAYSVTRRTQELGIRRALGADESNLVWLILQQALGLSLAGALLGLIAAYALTQALKSMLFQITPTDPLTFAAVSALFILVALVASYVPALRAMRIHPATALRYE